MKIAEAITAINRMQADGVIHHYAIGGAVGATFYMRLRGRETLTHSAATERTSWRASATPRATWTGS